MTIGFDIQREKELPMLGIDEGTSAMEGISKDRSKKEKVNMHLAKDWPTRASILNGQGHISEGISPFCSGMAR
jgi:hypothetical protein